MEKGRRPNRRCSRDWSSALNLILLFEIILQQHDRISRILLVQAQCYWFYS